MNGCPLVVRHAHDGTWGSNGRNVTRVPAGAALASCGVDVLHRLIDIVHISHRRVFLRLVVVVVIAVFLLC